MASTSYLARVIYKTHGSSQTNLAGTYNLMLAAKSIPAPMNAPNTVESTTFEDDTQTFEMGVKQSGAKEITGNLDKSYLDALNTAAGTECDIIHLYGNDGVGGVAKYAYVGEFVVTPNDVSGVDSIIEMTATVVPNTVPELITDNYTVTANNDGTFTVAVKNQ